MHKAFVLLSGGIDSSTALGVALDDLIDSDDEIEACAISVHYGQRHAKELDAAKAVADHYGVEHTVIQLTGVLGGVMLTDPNAPIPNASYDQLPAGVSPTYVPFRNGLMLSLIAAEAQKWVNAEYEEGPPRKATIYFGAHAEDAHRWAYPDCTPEFTGAMANAIYVGTYHAVRLRVPFQYNTKDQIISRGFNLGVPYKLTWSCYAGGKMHCGTCPTCRARKGAFEQARLPDPTEYADQREYDPNVALRDDAEFGMKP